MNEVAPGFAPLPKRGRPKKPVEEPKKVLVGRVPLRGEDFAKKTEYSLAEDDEPDRLKIAKALIPEGVDLQWVTDTILGQPQPQRRARFQRRGWQAVHCGDFDGRFDYFMPDGHTGEISVDGLVLHCRPMELTLQARKRDEFRARQQVAIKEQQIHGGDIQGVTLDTRHQTALRTNKVNKTYEQIPVPHDDE